MAKGGKAELLDANNPVLLDEKPTIRQRIAAMRKEYSYILLGAFLPAIIFFVIYLGRGMYPFGNGTVLVLDLNGQYAYFFEHLRNCVMDGDNLLYSWSRAMGGEFLGMYAYYIASPLSYLICLFPYERTQEFLLILFMIKAALCGGTMAFYLHKHSVGKNKLTVVTFAVMYALSAYCVVYQSNTMWIDAVMWLPLVVYGVEQLIKYGKYKMFVIFLALTIASNFYIGYMVCIFVMLYYFFYMLAYSDNFVNNPTREKKHFLKSFIRIAVFSAIAVAMAALLILCAYYSLQFGKNEFTDPTWEIEMKFDFFDLMFKFLPTSYDTVRIDGLPWVYCGLFTVILAPLFFCSQKFTAREKIASAALIMILILSMMITVTDLVWHGFQKPQWLNARFSFMLCFFLIFIAFRTFDNFAEIKAHHLGVVAAFIFSFVMILQATSEDFKKKLLDLAYGPNEEDFIIHEFATILLSVICLILYVSIIAVMSKAKNKDLVSAVLLITVCGELFFSSIVSIDDFDKDVGFTTYQSYNEFQTMFRPITDTLTDEYDDSFYRFEKTYHRKLNDNMALDIRGLSNSTSTLNKDTINFLQMMGYYSKSHKSQYTGGSLPIDSFLGIKYLISNRDYTPIFGDPVLTGKDYANHLGITEDELYDKTVTTKYKNHETKEYFSSLDFDVYYNPYALSIAFASSRDILNVNMNEHNVYTAEDAKNYNELYNPDGYTNPFARFNAMITAILGEDETVEIFKPAVQNGEPTLQNVKYSNSSTGHDLYKKTGDGVGKITYTYTVPEGEMLYLFFPAHYNRQIQLSSSTMPIFDTTREDGTLRKSGINYDYCDDRIVELGYAPGNEYSLTVTIDNTSNEFYTKPDDAFVYYVDMELFSQVFSKIKDNQLILDEDYEEDDLHGTLKTNENNQLILTTIAYDEGWNVYVDGERVDVEEACGALLAFTVDKAGKHDIRLVYRSSAFKIGIIISASAIALFILIIVFEKKLKKISFIAYFMDVKLPVPQNTDAKKLPGNKASSLNNTNNQKGQ